MKKTVLFLTAVFGLSGCGTVVKLIDPNTQYQAYAGTRYDWQQTQQWGGAILDLPLSFLLDTALLPYVWMQK
ncbi:MAG: lipoprotein [Pasteurellaceae bacterium]|nr:lipoprotein [Pasteurellaceae bacterium]